MEAQRMAALACLALIGIAGDATASHVPADEIEYVLPPDSIPAITSPRFDDGSWLRGSDLVLGLEIEGEARAYPLRILVWHEIVDDVVADAPVAVTYCPLCGTGIVYGRVVEGDTFEFKVSGLLYKSDLVMYDTATGTYWSQVTGEAIQGTHHGRRLGMLPSVTTTWDAWREAHPATRVLSRETGHDRDYDRDPYAGYTQTRRIGITDEQRGDVYAMHPKEFVLGYERAGQALAIRWSRLGEVRVAMIPFADQELVSTWDGVAAHLYDSGGHFFEHHEGQMVDEAGGRWNLSTGRGPAGMDLTRVPAIPGFWFAWYDFHPDTRVWGALGVAATDPRGGASGVGQRAAVRIEFTEEIDPVLRESVESWLHVEPSTPWKATWESNRAVVVEPVDGWPRGTVTVIVDGILRDRNGNELGQELALQFSTEGHVLPSTGLLVFGAAAAAAAAGIRRRRGGGEGGADDPMAGRDPR